MINAPESWHSSLTASVSDFMIEGGWNLSADLFVKFPAIAAEMSKIVSLICKDPDQLIWCNNDSGILSMKEAFKFLNNSNCPVSWSKFIWSPCVPPSRSFLVWRIFHKRLPTDDNLRSRGCITVSTCDLCGLSSETSDHLFLQCSFACSIWSWVGNILHHSFDLASADTIFSILKNK